jgi:hypothetical protein
MALCKSCGNEVEESASFCTTCGQRMPAGVEPSAQAAALQVIPILPSAPSAVTAWQRDPRRLPARVLYPAELRLLRSQRKQLCQRLRPFPFAHLVESSLSPEPDFVQTADGQRMPILRSFANQ